MPREDRQLLMLRFIREVDQSVDYAEVKTYTRMQMFLGNMVFGSSAIARTHFVGSGERLSRGHVTRPWMYNSNLWALLGGRLSRYASPLIAPQHNLCVTRRTGSATRYPQRLPVQIS